MNFTDAAYHLKSDQYFPYASDICYCLNYWFISYEYNISPDNLRKISTEKDWQFIKIEKDIHLVRYNYPNYPSDRFTMNNKSDANRKLVTKTIKDGLFCKTNTGKLKIVYDARTERLYLFSVIHGVPRCFGGAESLSNGFDVD